VRNEYARRVRVPVGHLQGKRAIDADDHGVCLLRELPLRSGDRQRSGTCPAGYRITHGTRVQNHLVAEASELLGDGDRIRLRAPGLDES
jgi:hypothetical protein